MTGRGLQHGVVSLYNAQHGRGGLQYDAQQRARDHNDTTRDTAGRALRQGPARATTRPRARCDTAPTRAATLPGARCDTAGRALRHGRARSAT